MSIVNSPKLNDLEKIVEFITSNFNYKPLIQGEEIKITITINKNQNSLKNIPTGRTVIPAICDITILHTE